MYAQNKMCSDWFAQAMRAGLQGTMRVKGLLEMMFEVLSDWIDAFIEDIEEVSG